MYWLYLFDNILHTNAVFLGHFTKVTTVLLCLSVTRLTSQTFSYVVLFKSKNHLLCNNNKKGKPIGPCNYLTCLIIISLL